MIANFSLVFAIQTRKQEQRGNVWPLLFISPQRLMWVGKVLSFLRCNEYSKTFSKWKTKNCILIQYLKNTQCHQKRGEWNEDLSNLEQLFLCTIRGNRKGILEYWITCGLSDHQLDMINGKSNWLFSNEMSDSFNWTEIWSHTKFRVTCQPPAWKTWRSDSREGARPSDKHSQPPPSPGWRNWKTQQSLVIFVLEENSVGKSLEFRDAIVFIKFSLHTKTKTRRLQIPPVWRALSKSSVFVTD